jgi:hypothetical protein
VKNLLHLPWGVALVLTVFTQIPGAANIPDLVRMAPGVNVAQIDQRDERSVFGKVTWRF